VDGHLVERNAGEREHSILQGELIIYFGSRRKEWYPRIPGAADSSRPAPISGAGRVLVQGACPSRESVHQSTLDCYRNPVERGSHEPRPAENR
jgi:hypothetical protein